MKAVFCTRYGPPDVLQLRDVEKPVPKDDEVLVRVHAATVMAGDCELRSMKGSFLWQLVGRIGFGFRGPRKKILGQELAGVVESVGKDVRLFRVGDQVFANTGLHLGAYAEYDCLRERGPVALKPANMSFEEAATLPAASVWVLPLVSKGNIRSGEKVLVIGAGGTMGTLAVQLAKSLGAVVTAVDSGGKLEMLRSIGADAVIDYTVEDFANRGETFDVVMDMVGKSPFSSCVRSLKEGGIFLLGNARLSQILRGFWASRTSGKRVIMGRGAYGAETLATVRGLVEEGKVRAVIDKRYPLERTAEAHAYVDAGQKKGNVVISVSPGADAGPRDG